MVELDETHAALGQAPGQQTIGREGAIAGLFDAVEIQDVVRLFGEIG